MWYSKQDRDYLCVRNLDNSVTAVEQRQTKTTPKKRKKVASPIPTKCINYENGYCRKCEKQMNECKYNHILCRYDEEDSCTKGNKCKFIHGVKGEV